MTNIHTEQLLRVLLNQAHAAREVRRFLFSSSRGVPASVVLHGTPLRQKLWPHCANGYH